jgi:hypothetical protein
VKKRRKRAGWEHERKKGNMFGMFYFGVYYLKTIFPFSYEGVCTPAEPTCRVVFENEQDNSRLTKTQRQCHLVTSEPQHVSLTVFELAW